MMNHTIHGSGLALTLLGRIDEIVEPTGPRASRRALEPSWALKRTNGNDMRQIDANPPMHHRRRPVFTDLPSTIAMAMLIKGRHGRRKRPTGLHPPYHHEKLEMYMIHPRYSRI
jgi:hypothetical protein